MSSTIIPVISKLNNLENRLVFTLSGVDVSFANSIRRSILADVNIVAFSTSPNERNDSNFTINTTRLNNEILKQRLSCIPIHITDVPINELQNLILEVNEENLTDTIYTVTTAHFKIRHKQTNTYLKEQDVRKIFPPFQAPNGVNYFIEFVRLRPKISDDILGEKISFTCEFSISSAKENSMFNVTGTCGYGFTVDETTSKIELRKQQQQWKDEGIDESNYNIKSANWMLLERKRFVIRDSFDFILESVGVFENDTIIRIACQALINKFNMLITQITLNKLKFNKITSNLNTFDYILQNEDYTIGNILNHLLFKNYYEGAKLISYIGFKKMHPHDLHSIIRITYTDVDDESTYSIGTEYIKQCCEEAINLITLIQNNFNTNLQQIGYNNIEEEVQNETKEDINEPIPKIISNSPPYNPPSPDKTPSPGYNPPSPGYAPSPDYNKSP